MYNDSILGYSILGKQTEKKYPLQIDVLFHFYAISVQIFMENSSIISAVSLLFAFCEMVVPVAFEHLYVVRQVPDTYRIAIFPHRHFSHNMHRAQMHIYYSTLKLIKPFNN